MTDIFVSYAKQDRERVRQLVFKLEEHGWRIWWDREIKTGKSFESEIEKAIDNAKCILVVWSHASVESEWVRAEANEGLDRKILIPIAIDDVRPPLAYRRIQTSFLIGWPEGNHREEFSRLTASIHNLLDSKVQRDGRDEDIASERRHISVLTGKITKRQEIYDPETSHEENQEFKDTIRQLILKYGGFSYRLTGSHFIVIFGIPSTHEEDTLNAVTLAFQLQEVLSNRMKRVASDGSQVTMECSIASGLVIASKENARLNEYSITGDVLDIGAKLLEVASPNEILVSASAYKIIASYVQAEEKVVGNQPAYKIISATSVTSRIEAAELKGFTEFFGREKEIADILDRYATASKGSGQVVTLIGEAGIGKSRLLYEVRKKLPFNEIFVLEGRCQSFGSHTAYHPYLGMLRQYLKLTNVPAAQLHDVAVKAMLTVFRDLEQYIPHYLYLLSIPSTRYQLPSHLQGESMRLALQEALVSILAVIAMRKPLVIILEDWHWADAASTDLLQHLIDVAVSFPMLIIISCRPEYHPEWTSLDHCSIIKVSNFSREQTRTIISRLVKVENIPVQFVDDLHQRTGGNPFFIEELCTSLLEQKKIHVSDDKLIVRDGTEKLDLPDSIQAVLRTRLDQLDREAREIVQTASVIGREFSRKLLALSSGKMIDPVLRGLVEIGIISQTRVLPEPEYIFKHALIQMVAYETMLVKYRKKLHRLVASKMIELYPDGIPERTEILAHHFALSDDVDNAIRYAMLSGERALARSAYQESLVHFKNTEQFLDSLPDESSTHKLKLRNLLAMGPALVVTQGYSAPSVIETYLKACDYSKTLGAIDEWFAALWGLWRSYYNSCMLDRATEAAYQLLEIAKQSNKVEELHSAYAALITSEMLNGNIHKGLAFVADLRSTYNPETERSLAIRYGLSPIVLGLSFAANSAILAGNPSKGLAFLEEALIISQKIDHAGSEVLALFYSVSARLLEGNMEEAIRSNNQLLQIAKEKKFPHWIALAEFNEVRENLRTGGNMSEKISDLLAKAKHAASLVPVSVATSHLALATLFIAMGQFDKSLLFIANAQDLIGLFTPEFLRLKAKALNKLRPEEALETLDTALALAAEKNNSLWKLRILLEQIPIMVERNLPISKKLELLEETVDTFSGAIEIPEVTNARKHILSWKETITGHSQT